MKTLSRFFVWVAVLTVALSVNAEPNAYPVTDSDKQFFRTIQKAFANDDSKWLSTIVSYPIDVHITNAVVRLSNKGDFQKNAKLIMNRHLKLVVQHQSVNSLFKNWQGIIVGSGEIWFSQIGEESVKDKSIRWVYRITALNLDVLDAIPQKHLKGLAH